MSIRLFVLLVFSFYSQAFADFSQDVFLRHELVRQGYLKKAAKFSIGDKYTFTTTGAFKKTTIVTIVALRKMELQYQETQIKKSSVKKMDGLIDLLTGQLKKLRIDNDNMTSPAPYEPIHFDKVSDYMKINTPAGKFPSYLAEFSPGRGMYESWYICEDAPGTGLVKGVSELVMSSTTQTWID